MRPKILVAHGKVIELERLRRSFLRWFQKYPLIYDSHLEGDHRFDYYLEGSSQNWGAIRAFPSGLAALKDGQYFIPGLETDGRLEILRRTLALRGVIYADLDQNSPDTALGQAFRALVSSKGG